LKIHSWMASSEIHDNFVTAKVVTWTESKSVSLRLRRFETCRTILFPLKHTLKIHSWMLSSHVHLKWSWPSGYWNRIKICFSSTAQVWNLPNNNFSIRTRLEFTHG
jgi:hypothetical protein